MAAPSWLPSWPAGWPDFVGAFKEWIPAEFPLGLWKRGGQAWLDLQAIGESLALPRQFLEVLLRYHLPSRDTLGLFLDRWEYDFQLEPAATITERVAVVTAKMREKGTLTLGRALQAVAACWGTSDSSLLSVTFPLASAMAAAAHATATTAQQWAELAFQLHIYTTAEDLVPDQTAFGRLVARIAPLVDSWSCGRWCYAEYDDDTETEQGDYDEAVYDDD